jgi:inhibitor of cysteine peptidase
MKGKKLLKYVLPLLVIFLLDKCEMPQKSLNLSEEDNRKQFILSKEGEIQIALKAIPSAGYTWTISNIDTSLLKQIGEMKFKPESKKLGSPGKQIFHFQSTHTGKITLQFIYHRPWEREKPPANTFEVTIQVVE